MTSSTWPNGVGDGLDRAIGLLFQSGLILSSLAVDADVETAARLREISEHIDAAVQEIRTAALTRVGDERARQARVDRADQRILRRVNIDEVFAYAIGPTDFYRVTDDQLWAHDSDGLLLSARSGTPLAQRHGRIYHDPVTDLPLYYEPPFPDTPS